MAIDTQGGSTQYDEVNGQGSFLSVYHDVFRVLFQPSPGLAKVIEEKMHHNTIALIPGHYSVAHYRAEYGNEVKRHRKLTEPSYIQQIAWNALKCAMDLQPGNPIYFASDSMIALETVRRVAAMTKYPIHSFDRDESIVLKLDDTGVDLLNMSDPTLHVNPYPPKAYYSTFVDLYLAGNGGCVTFGRGGFGRFANLLSYNATCVFKHVKQFYPVPCEGKAPLDQTKEEMERAIATWNQKQEMM